MPPQKLPHELSRRSLFKTGLLGVALISVGSAALLLQPPRSENVRGKLAIFDAKEAAILAALARRLCPPAGPGSPGADAIGLVALLDKALLGADDEAVKGLKVGLAIFDNALTGALFGERVRPFSQLDGEAQDAVIRNWQRSSVAFRRMLIHGLASLTMSVYWGDPRTWPSTGYGGPPDARALRASYAENLVDLDALRASPAAKET
jgi:Gluconate 2-dehydrogenase subunit 3